MNEALLDVNLLIASIVQNHADHQRARVFLASLSRIYTTPMTQGGFLRFMTRPWKNEKREDQPPRMTMAEGLDSLKDVTNWPRHAFLPDDLPFTSVPLRSLTGHRQWTDAYLLRLASSKGLRLATFDRRMSNLDDTDSPCLLLVP